jgi:hypothetical protein
MITLTEDHRYIDDATGAEYPGVTTVIKDAGMMGWLTNDNYYLKRGTYVHEACALWDLGLLEEADLSPGLTGFLSAWKKYRADTGFTPAPDFIERICFDPILLYAGTIDRDGLDIKAGESYNSHKIQCAAYWHFQGNSQASWKSVYLNEDGTYKIKVYSPSELYAAFKVFTAALTVYNWRKENRIQ